MAFQPVPNTAVVDIIFSYFDQRCENVIHVTKASAWSSADLGTLCDNVIAWWKTYLRPVVTQDLVLLRVEARDLTSEGGAFNSRDCLTECNGQETSPGLPGNVTLAISLRTTRAGRNYRGRVYHLGLAENQVTGNTLVGALPATLDTAYTALLSTLAGLGWTWTVVSRVLDGVVRPVGVATPIVNISVDSDTDSMRRRLIGRGS